MGNNIYKNKQSILFFIIHHFFRVIWANIIGIIYNIRYLWKIWFSYLIKKNDIFLKTYKNHKKLFNDIKNIQDLVNFFDTVYKYKWDGYFGKDNIFNGLFDHNNFDAEWFLGFGDCDDMSRWTCKALKKLKKLKIVDKVIPIGLIDTSIKGSFFWHYDCIYKKGDMYYQFNYGEIIEGKSIEECVYKMYEKFITYGYKVNPEKGRWWRVYYY